MSENRGNSLTGTRGRILALLCGADRTTGDLARELGISATGVRGHLSRLEGEGLVEHEAVRQGVGKPAHRYRLTAAGAARMSRAYLPLLSGLLDVVSGRAGPEEEEVLLREAGRAIAGRHPRPEGDLRRRAQSAVDLIADLGGIGELREEDERLWIEGACCPVHALVSDHPLACKAVEEMLTELMGVPVHEACVKELPPSCRLEIGSPSRR